MPHISGAKARLGENPEIKVINGDGEDAKTVCEFRAYFTKPKKVGNEWKDEGFWATVSIWDKYAEACGEFYAKGDMVRIDGTLLYDKWDDDDGEQQTAPRVKARSIDPVLTELSMLSYQPRGSGSDAQE